MLASFLFFNIFWGVIPLFFFSLFMWNSCSPLSTYYIFLIYQWLFFSISYWSSQLKSLSITIAPLLLSLPCFSLASKWECKVSDVNGRAARRYGVPSARKGSYGRTIISSIALFVSLDLKEVTRYYVSIIDSLHTFSKDTSWLTWFLQMSG